LVDGDRYQDEIEQEEEEVEDLARKISRGAKWSARFEIKRAKQTPQACRSGLVRDSGKGGCRGEGGRG